MTTRAEIKERLERNRQLLSSGVTSSTVAGESVSFDLDRIARQVAQDEATLGQRPKRARVFNLNMGGR